MSDANFDQLSQTPLSPNELTPRSRSRVVILASFTVALVAIALVAILATRPQAGNVQAPSPLVGQNAPSISGTSLNGNGFINLSAFRGKYVVINFFASWCTPCQIEEPELVQFAYQHGKTGDAVVLGVAFNDPSSDAENFLHSSGSTWPSIDDTTGSIATAFGVSEPPETFVINPQGIVLAKLIGPVTDQGLDSVISKAKSLGE
ncbi:MAG: TlpA family protein disulfide reductase [Acidimicrobiales bacterium]|nr:TlpA family protein disulfide reductase [Acidimicrobiales bacterium]